MLRTEPPKKKKQQKIRPLGSDLNLGVLFLYLSDYRIFDACVTLEAATVHIR